MIWHQSQPPEVADTAESEPEFLAEKGYRLADGCHRGHLSASRMHRDRGTS